MVVCADTSFLFAVLMQTRRSSPGPKGFGCRFEIHCGQADSVGSNLASRGQRAV